MSAIMDFPTAWAFIRGTKPEQHNPKCAWITEGGALLCDCRVLWDEYDRRKALRETEGLATINQVSAGEAVKKGTKWGIKTKLGDAGFVESISFTSEGIRILFTHDTSKAAKASGKCWAEILSKAIPGGKVVEVKP